jgi:peptide/nickel transport system permease protein
MNGRFVAVKLLRALVTLWIAVTFVFIVLRVTGDPAEILLPDHTPPQVVDEYRQRWGLDRSLPEQYAAYLFGVLRGDLGISFRDGRDAVAVVLERVPASLQLGLTAFAFTCIVGIALGVFAALHHGSVLDRLAMVTAVLGYSMPNFFLGVLLILLFSLHLQVLPSSGNATLWHLIMPALTLGTAHAAGVARFTRSAMLEVLNQAYMRTARAKGVPATRRIRWHALPNAAIPVMTVLGFRLGALVAAAVVTENVFGWPGVGRLLVTSVGYRDLAVVQSIVLLVTFTMVTVNLAVDLLYGWVDPRLRHGGVPA